MVQYILMFVAILSGSIEAHQFTPTYPELSGSYVKGISSANMQLFNRRNDASYYEIGVFDKDWNKVPFATPTKIIRVDYLKTVKFDVFIRNKDKSRAVYVCTKSKLIVNGSAITSVSSRICSKFR
tara:strand:- start:1061 stop:1435 length:375 start_codon:yes stop_codon:yes gene_type:complete